MKIWVNNVIPSLFPFFIATELLSYTDVCDKLGKIFSKIMKPLFNVPGCGSYAFIIGLISGYPVGAKIVTELRMQKRCSKSEAESLLAFTNNSGPLFIIGTVGITLFANSSIGFLLLITHVLSAITVGILLRFVSKKDNVSSLYKSNVNIPKTFSPSNIGDVLKNSIVCSIKNILIIGGFIVFFAVVISVLTSSHFIDFIMFIFSPLASFFKIDISYFKGLLIGLLELTNGLAIICSVHSKKITLNILFCAFALGFGGISVLFQVWSIISKSDLSIKRYTYSKILQGIIAVIYTYIFINCFSIFNFNL